MGGATPGARVLEIGCGQGEGARILLRDFCAREVHAFDLDSRQLRRAKRRIRHLPERKNIFLWQGSAGQIPSPVDHYQAAFDFNVLHHISNWQEALREIARALEPGAKFYILETLRPFLENPINRILMKHPRENRFDFHELCEGLKDAGFQLQHSRHIARSFCWVVAKLEK